MERITLEQFRDDVVLNTNIENVIQDLVRENASVYEIPRSVIQMLLVLGEIICCLKLETRSLLSRRDGVGTPLLHAICPFPVLLAHFDILFVKY